MWRTQSPVQRVHRSEAVGVKLITHIHLLPRLRMSGAIALIPLYAFRAWTGKTLLMWVNGYMFDVPLSICMQFLPQNY
jgi:hypothetical protein